MDITYNGITSQSLGVEKVMRVTRPVYSGARDRLLRISGRPGAVDFGRDIEPGYIPTRLFLQAESFAAKRAQLRQIAAWLNQEQVKQLIFSDEQDKFYLARPASLVNPEDSAYKTWLDVTWLCPDPHAYALTTKTSSPNEGTASTPVKITATMTGDTDHLQITLGGQIVRLETDLVTGDEVIIDTNQGWVALNGLDARQYVTYDSDLRLMLPVGAFTLTADNATLSIVYRERWT